MLLTLYARRNQSIESERSCRIDHHRIEIDLLDRRRGTHQATDALNDACDGLDVQRRLAGVVAGRRPELAAGVLATVVAGPFIDAVGVSRMFRLSLAVFAFTPEMLAASLAEGPGLRVLDSERVYLTLEGLKPGPGPLP